jgi:hypothetical protein
LGIRFGARYDYASDEIKADIVKFAAAKLLGGRSYPPEEPLKDNEKLACLAQRLPIEFNSTTYTAQSQEMEQVEGHLRVCLKVDSSFQSMQTVSSSEPLLSEAAYWIMQDENFDAVGALKSILGGFSIDKGDRGELLVMMLLTLARDFAVGPADRSGKPKERWMPVVSLFQSLFRAKSRLPLSQHANIFTAKGRTVGGPRPLSYGKDFKKTFSDSKFYFNHWIKVHQWGVLNAKYLLSLYCRGAAVLCANSQPGIDGLMPFLWEGTTIAQDNLSVCLWQSKNDPTYTDKVQTGLFERMDPFSLKIFDPDTPLERPIIRIVFALAASKPSLQVAQVKQVTNEGGQSFVAYDIWCSGLSPDILVPITPEKEDTWQALLQRSYGWQDVYNGENVPKGLRRSMNPGAGMDMDHWSQWNETEMLT